MLKKLTLIAGACLLFSSASHAQQLGNLFWNQEIVPAPLDGVRIDYRVFGSSPLAQIQAEFFLSGDQNPNTGLSLGTTSINFRCTPGRLCAPPAGPQSYFVRSFNLPPATRDFLNNVQNSCTPSGPFFAVGSLLSNRQVSFNSAMFGSNKAIDFLFDMGTFSPSVLPNNGTANVSFRVQSGCLTNLQPEVAVLLADSQFNILGLVTTFLASPGATQSFNLNFGAINLPPDDYNLILFADSSQQIGESNENNNLGSFSFTLTNSFLNNENAFSNRSITEYIDRTPLIDTEEVTFDLENLPVLEGLIDGDMQEPLE